MGRFPTVGKEIVSEEKRKPVLDEETLAKLLEAAYVLQEHNRELQEMELGLSLKRDQIEAEDRSAASSRQVPPQVPGAEPAANADYTLTLAQIVETQHQIQVRQLETESAMSLVAERLRQMARASGAAIGILEGKKLNYKVASGLLTLPAGTRVPMDKALCVPCLRTGQVFRCEDVNPEFLLDTEECHRRGIQALIAVPIFHDGGVVGGLELYYPQAHAFTEQDVHTCQLMAGLVTEAVARDEEKPRDKSYASERAAMLQALEKLKPNLAALVEGTATKESVARTGSASAVPSATVTCRKCGHELVGEEQFCGNCGTPRSSDYEAPSMQSKVASLWHMQEALKKNSPAETLQDGSVHGESPTATDGFDSDKSLADSLEEQMPELFKAFKSSDDSSDDNVARPPESQEGPISAEFEDSVLLDLDAPLNPGEEAAAQTPPSTALAKSDRGSAWSSAASARDFLEQLAPSQRQGGLAHFWNSRRGDIYLAIAVLLVMVVLRWGVWSDHSVSATASSAPASAGHRKASPDADLSTFDRMLISLGLSEPPPAPEYKGNPETQVWVDLHTGLYYCPGDDLFEKTPKGKFTSQRDAQLDQFEPAYRKTCE